MSCLHNFNAARVGADLETDFIQSEGSRILGHLMHWLRLTKETPKPTSETDKRLRSLETERLLFSPSVGDYVQLIFVILCTPDSIPNSAR
jgi:hypothetical protein